MFAVGKILLQECDSETLANMTQYNGFFTQYNGFFSLPIYAVVLSRLVSIAL